MTRQPPTPAWWLMRAVAASFVVMALFTAPVLAQEAGGTDADTASEVTGTLEPTIGAPGDPITVSGTCPEGYRYTVVTIWTDNQGASVLAGVAGVIDEATGAFSTETSVQVLPPGAYLVQLGCVHTTDDIQRSEPILFTVTVGAHPTSIDPSAAPRGESVTLSGTCPGSYSDVRWLWTYRAPTAADPFLSYFVTLDEPTTLPVEPETGMFSGAITVPTRGVRHIGGYRPRPGALGEFDFPPGPYLVEVYCFNSWDGSALVALVPFTIIEGRPSAEPTTPPLPAAPANAPATFTG